MANFIQELSDFIKEDTKLDVTLFVKGVIISGTLLSDKDYRELKKDYLDLVRVTSYNPTQYINLRDAVTFHGSKKIEFEVVRFILDEVDGYTLGRLEWKSIL